jgi:hypothetical protein
MLNLLNDIYVAHQRPGYIIRAAVVRFHVVTLYPPLEHQRNASHDSGIGLTTLSGLRVDFVGITIVLGC